MPGRPGQRGLPLRPETRPRSARFDLIRGRDGYHQPTTDRFEINAPQRELLDQALDKWSLQVLNELCESPCRFSDLRRLIPAVRQKSLIATLRRLERNGVVERVVLSTRPVAIEYRITPLGKTLRSPVEAVLAWARVYRPAIEEARRRFDG